MPYGGRHDPGPSNAASRAVPLGDAAALPIEGPSGGWIRVGTASWTDPTMTAPGVFYPRDAGTAEERLAYYAGQFPLVEVDATYYALPSARTSELWVRRTPPGFVFDVKAHALMTGQPTETRRLPKSIRDALPRELAARPRLYGKDLPSELFDEVWRLFADGLEPLRASGQLGSVLLQYPRWVFPSSQAREAILAAKDRLGEVACAVEFRSAAWLSEKNAERTLRFLADNGIPYVMVDGPQGLPSSLPRSWRPPPRTSRSCAFTAGGSRRGRRRGFPPWSASATSTAATSSPNGCRASARPRRAAERRTSCSITASRTTAQPTRGSSPHYFGTSDWTVRRPNAGAPPGLDEPAGSWVVEDLGGSSCWVRCRRSSISRPPHFVRGSSATGSHYAVLPIAGSSGW